MTSQESQMSLFEESDALTLSAEDFRARLSVLRENGKDLKILEELCFLKSHGSHLFSDLACYSLRTSKDSSTMMGGDTFETILSALDELGYDAEWQVLNSKNFGVPQNRERVFIVGHLRGERTRGVFPFGRESQKLDFEQQGIKILGNTKNPHGTNHGTSSVVYDSKGLIGTLCARDYKEPKQIAIPVLTPERPEKRQNGRRFKSEGEPMFTLTSQDKHGIMIREATAQGYAEAEIGDSVNLAHPNSKTRRGRVGKGQANTLLTGESQGVVTPDFRIRKLTPRECWRLQGFPDWAFDKAQKVNSNSQLYKQAGNSVTVNVIAAIAKEMK